MVDAGETVRWTVVTRAARSSQWRNGRSRRNRPRLTSAAISHRLIDATSSGRAARPTAWRCDTQRTRICVSRSAFNGGQGGRTPLPTPTEAAPADIAQPVRAAQRSRRCATGCGRPGRGETSPAGPPPEGSGSRNADSRRMAGPGTRPNGAVGPGAQLHRVPAVTVLPREQAWGDRTLFQSVGCGATAGPGCGPSQIPGRQRQRCCCRWRLTSVAISHRLIDATSSGRAWRCDAARCGSTAWRCAGLRSSGCDTQRTRMCVSRSAFNGGRGGRTPLPTPTEAATHQDRCRSRWRVAREGGCPIPGARSHRCSRHPRKMLLRHPRRARPIKFACCANSPRVSNSSAQLLDDCRAAHPNRGNPVIGQQRRRQLRHRLTALQNRDRLAWSDRDPFRYMVPTNWVGSTNVSANSRGCPNCACQSALRRRRLAP